MKAVRRPIGRRAALGLVPLIAVSVALSGEPPASASAGPRSQEDRARQVRHERLLRKVSTPGGEEKGTAPWALDIPAIGVSAGLMTLGGPAPGAGYLALPTPPLARAASEAGWYQFSSVPGAAGNAVIVGHVDTYAGPGVFYNLYRLLPGESIYVTAGGARQRFAVTSAREVPKPRFPVNQVFGGTRERRLWLITCGGAFDQETGHYLDNIVVSATWVPTATGKR